MITIDIICPLFNASAFFERLMAGINKQKDIIISNIIFPVTESDDNTFELATNVSNSIVLPIARSEFSHSLTREMAMQHATSDVVVFLSQDVILEDEFALKNLSTCIDGQIVHAFSRQTTKSKGIEKYVRKKNYPNSSYVMSNEDIKKHQIKTFYSSDACSAYNRIIFLKLGGYDGKKMRVSEEMYFCRKAILAGYSIKYCAESVVIHSHSFSLKQLYKRYYDVGVFFAQNPEFKEYKSNGTGMSLAFYVLGQALKHFDIPVLFRWFPDFFVRYIGKKKGEHFKETKL